MAALCVTLDSTVAVSCTRTDDVVQSVVARSIIRPPVGGTHRTPAVDEPTKTCTHTFTRERVRNSTHGRQPAPHQPVRKTRRTATNPRAHQPVRYSTHGRQPKLRSRIHTQTREMHTHKHTFTHERVRKSTHGRHNAPRSRMHTVHNSMHGRHPAPRSHIHAFTHSPHDDARPPPFTHSHTLTQSATRRTAAIPPTPRIDAFDARPHDRPRCVSRASCVTRRECGRAAHLRRRMIHSSDRPSRTACRGNTSASQNALSRRGYG